MGPPLVRPVDDSDSWWGRLPEWMPDLNVLVPTACGLLVLLVGLCVLCVYLGSRNRNGAQRFKGSDGKRCRGWWTAGTIMASVLASRHGLSYHV